MFSGSATMEKGSFSNTTPAAKKTKLGLGKLKSLTREIMDTNKQVAAGKTVIMRKQVEEELSKELKHAITILEKDKKERSLRDLERLIPVLNSPG